ncbi:hypothetical protein FRC01_000530 [Tulasnella sp. 417]|nr:hypothetical protein FRC01_000530 [Tulasnella sp. 417]
MASSSLPPPLSSVTTPAPQIELDPDQFGAGPSPTTSDYHFVFIVCGTLAGIVALFSACAVRRRRMVRRRRAALGLPPVDARVRRPNSEYTDISDYKPAIYDAWVEIEVVTDGERPRWDQIQAPSNAEEKDNPFQGYFSSILELVSVDRLDKSLLKAAQKTRPPDYQKSELLTSFMIAMPQPRRHSAAEIRSLPELEFGVHESLCPIDRP